MVGSFVSLLLVVFTATASAEPTEIILNAGEGDVTPPATIILDDETWASAEPTEITLNAGEASERLLDEEFKPSVDEVTPGLYQGDMVLTEEQWQAVKQRKVISNQGRWWNTMVNGELVINYRFVDATLNQTKIEQALDQWRDNTCLKFNEISAADGNPHLAFTADPSSCSSPVGMNSQGNTIKLTTGCVNSIGSVVHEVGHSLGLYHEQSRVGRDDFVTINWSNIESGKEHNFNSETTENFGLPYDYTSIMHYGSSYFSANGQPTIETVDPLAQGVIGQRSTLSFFDIKAVNLQYQCTDKWLAASGLSADPCQNHGYIGRDGTCVCPAGTTGTNCETCVTPYNEAAAQLANPGNVRITSAGEIKSPSYPSPTTAAEGPYNVHILAPACFKAVLTFDDFNILAYQGACNYANVQVMIGNAATDDTEYCGAAITNGQSFTSTGRDILLTYDNRYIGTVGYKATVSFVSEPGCDASTVTDPSYLQYCPDQPTTTAAPTTAAPTTAAPTTAAPTTAAPTTAAPTTAAPTTAAPTTAAPTTAAPTTAAPTTAAPTTAAPTTAAPTTAAPTTAAPTTAAPTTTPPTTTGDVKIINSGIIPLLMRLFSSCRLTEVDATNYRYTSPRFPLNYRRYDSCSNNLYTREPRYLRITLTRHSTSSGDRHTLRGFFPPGIQTSEGQTFPSLTARVSSIFRAGFRSQGGIFDMNFEVVNSECHQIIRIGPGGGSGIIEIPAQYPAETVCEWWIIGPIFRRVKLEFSSFDIGDSTCLNDYVLIDRTGNRQYRYGQRFCGDNNFSPGTLVSTARKMNVLVNGWNGGYQGMIARYTLV